MEFLWKSANTPNTNSWRNNYKQLVIQANLNKNFTIQLKLSTNTIGTNGKTTRILISVTAVNVDKERKICFIIHISNEDRNRLVEKYQYNTVM